MRISCVTVALAASVALLCGPVTGCGGGVSVATGSEGGPCYPNGTCDEGLECMSDLCVVVTCSEGDTQSCTCSDGASGTQVCDADGQWGTCDCSLVCEAGTADCDNDPSNGCETTLGTVEDCGDCDDACSDVNATAACVADQCELTCDAGYDDCDGDPTTGCEAPLDTLTDCGTCGVVCGEVNATATCDGSGCLLTCEPGYDDCDGDAATGCEVALDTLTDCGACGSVCGEINATSTCDGTGCILTCDPGYADCDGDATNGCEADLSLPTSCGDCATVCSLGCTAGECDPCDLGLPVNASDPLDAALVLGLCSGVTAAQWVLPNGDPPPADPNYDLGHGLLDGFGPNVNVQEGTLLLGLSSGTARQPTDPGYQSVGGFDKGYSCGHPYGFPKESPSCPGVVTGQPHDGAALEITLQVPPTAQGFSFDFNFYTFEWPQYICSAYNDFFVAILDPIPAGQLDGNIAFDNMGNPVSVNTSLLEVCGCVGGPPCLAGGQTFNCSLGDAALAGTGFEGHAATGWLRTTAPVAPGTTITLRFGIYDSGDGILDSSVLLDNFRWLGTPTTIGTIPIPNPL